METSRRFLRGNWLPWQVGLSHDLLPIAMSDNVLMRFFWDVN